MSIPPLSIASSNIARDVIAIGPGLGTAPGTREFVKRLVSQATVSLVIDADGLQRIYRRSGCAFRTGRARTSS